MLPRSPFFRLAYFSHTHLCMSVCPSSGFSSMKAKPAALFRDFIYVLEHPMKAYTRVLKGHIGLATATFPDGTPGFMIDAFARRHLWEAGLDYQHGTGHGVGASLNVHEGPHVRSAQVSRVSAISYGLCCCGVRSLLSPLVSLFW